MMAVCWGEIVVDEFTNADDGSTHTLLGGCAAAVAAHLAAQGAEARLVSAVGCDEAGDQALAELRQRKVDVRRVTRLPRTSTARVRVRLAADGIPEFTPLHCLEWNAVDFEPELRAALVPDARLLVFALFAQGRELRLEGLARCLAAAPSVFVASDVNLRRAPAVATLERVRALSHLVKLNAAEHARAAAILASDPVAWFLSGGRTRFVSVTRGAEGAALSSARERWSERVEAPAMLDTVGAGDAYLARLSSALCTGADPRGALRAACTDAARHVAVAGALPPMCARQSHHPRE